MKSAEEILENQVSPNGSPMINYISKQELVWKMILGAMKGYAEQQVLASKKKHDEEFVVLLGKEHGNVFWSNNKDIDTSVYYVLEYTNDEKRAVEVCDRIRKGVVIC